MSLDASEHFSQQIIRQLAKQREGRGVTKEKLSKLSGISRPMISMMESGQRHPTLVTVHALCSALGFKMSEIVALAEAESTAKGNKGKG